MRTLVKITFIFFFLIIPVSLLAQADKNNVKHRAINFSAGYSYNCITSNINYTDNVINSKLNKIYPMSSDYCDQIVGCSFGIAYEFSEIVELDFTFAYAHNHGKLLPSTSGQKVSDGNLKYTEDWFTLMPGIKVNWLRTKIGQKGRFLLYSRGNIGLSLGNRYEILTAGTNINSAGALAYQITPIGLEIGTRVSRFFLEGGYGYTGYARAGFRFRLELDKDNAGDGLTGDSWYKDYLKL